MKEIDQKPLQGVLSAMIDIFFDLKKKIRNY
jgi:hypothetical protein